MQSGFYYNKNALRKETIEVVNYKTGNIKIFELADKFNWYEENNCIEGSEEAKYFNPIDRQDYYDGNGYTNPTMLIDSIDQHIEKEVQRRLKEELEKRGIEQ